MNKDIRQKRGESMFELIKRSKRQLTQFTVTVDSSIKEELAILAKKENMVFHAFIKAILLSYIKYKKQNEIKK